MRASLRSRCIALALVALLFDNASALPAELPGEKGVYQSAFESEVPTAFWSDTRSFLSPRGDRRLLGGFKFSQPAVLSLEGLPAHRFARLRCTLYVIGTADGARPAEKSPDLWSVGVVGGQLLMLTSFDNRWSRRRQVDVDDGLLQAFPDEYPAGEHEGRTGMRAANDLGFGAGQWSSPKSFDAAYDLDIVFPHAADSLQLRFQGAFSSPAHDEQWALGDVEVTVADGALAWSQEQLDELWSSIVSDEAVVASRAVEHLVSGGAAAAEFVGRRAIERLNTEEERRLALSKAVEKDVDAAVRLLRSESFKNRQIGQKKLSELGEAALPLLSKMEQMSKDDLDIEVRRILAKTASMLRDLYVGSTAARREAMVQSRCKRILRTIDTEASRQDLAVLLAAGRQRGAVAKEVSLGPLDVVRAGADWGAMIDPATGIHRWMYPAISFYWKTPHLVAGRYRVAAEVAPAEMAGGDLFELSLAGQPLLGKVPPAENEADRSVFRELVLGEVTLTDSGSYPLHLRSVKVVGAEMMDLRRVVLRPVAE